MAGVDFTPFDPGLSAAQLDLYLTVNSGDGEQDWVLDLTYATDIFDEPRIRGLLTTLTGVLDRVLADPSTLIGDLPI
ncbi:hypothetical protein, partial [Gordonia sp. ABSL49_1]|uniref:hypothetical protein n=1 Tax=Gordonia sp. ABSL49_1 TaxID=2920941 RepID=UPI001F0E5291